MNRNSKARAKAHFGSGKAERQENWEGKTTRYLNLRTRIVTTSSAIGKSSADCLDENK